MESPDEPLIKSYVWHAGKCFFVSTIDRDSSVAVIPPMRFAETMVWAYDWETRERGDSILFMEGDRRGDIYQHIAVCKRLHATGNPEIPE